MKRSAHKHGGKRVFILTGDVDGNIGDRAILQATCGILKSINPDRTENKKTSKKRKTVKDVFQIIYYK